MSSSVFSAILAEPSGAQHYSELEAYLEGQIDNLVAQHALLGSFLTNLMELEQQAAVRFRFTMGITYLTAALVVSGHATTDVGNAAVVLDVVERHLLPENSAAYAQLRGHKYALQRFEQVLNGYITVLDAQDKSDYSRKLHYLQRATFLFAPSPDHLTVAHALLLREAARSCCPAPALAIMRRPVLEISPADTGAGLVSFYNYYCEGGLLLATLRCWDDAAEQLRAVVSLGLCARRVAAPSPQSASVAAVNKGMKGCDVVVRATKAFILVLIICTGGLLDAEDHKRALRVVQKFSASNVDPYLRLLSAAAQRDGKLWRSLESHFCSLWKHDEMAELVAEAGVRLRRHVVRDVAKVASRIYLSGLIAALRSHSLEMVGDVGRTVDKEEEEAIALIQLLLSMHSEGEMQVGLEHVVREGGKTEKKEKKDTTGVTDWKNLVVRFSLPPRRSYPVLGKFSCGFDALCLSDSDSDVKKRFDEAQLLYSIEERIQRCSRAYAALLRAAKCVNGESAQFVRDYAAS